MRVADKAVSKFALVVADVRMVEAGVAFEHGLAAHMPLARQRDRQHGVAHRRALAQCTPAAARALQVAAREARAQRDGAVHLVFVEPAYFRRRDRAAEDAEYGTRMKAARRQRRNEIRRKALHHFIAGRDSGDKFLAGSAGFLGRRQGGRRHAGARMHEHAERVPLPARERHFRIGERSAAFGDFLAAHQYGRSAPHPRFFPADKTDRVATWLGLRADQYRRQALQRDAFRAIDHCQRQVVIRETGHPSCKLAAERYHVCISIV